MWYHNKSTENGWVKLEELDFGAKRPVWSESVFFNDLDPFNFHRGFYYMDDFNDGYFGTFAKISFFDRLFYMELATAQMTAIKVGADTGNFSYSGYYGFNNKWEKSFDWPVNWQKNGFNITYRDGICYKIYLEGNFTEIRKWPFAVYPVLGASVNCPGNVSLTAELSYEAGANVFLCAVFDKPFGWQGWEANVSGVYYQGGYNNVITLFGLKDNTGIFQYEFRYGYESMGNHRIDINLRLAQDWNINLTGDQTPKPEATPASQNR